MCSLICIKKMNHGWHDTHSLSELSMQPLPHTPRYNGSPVHLASVKYLHSVLMYVISVLNNRQVWSCCYLVSSGARPLVASMVLLLMPPMGRLCYQRGRGARLLLRWWSDKRYPPLRRQNTPVARILLSPRWVRWHHTHTQALVIK